jgi:hypothetical protein
MSERLRETLHNIVLNVYKRLCSKIHYKIHTKMTDQTSTDDIASSALSDAQPYTGTDMSTKYKYLFDIVEVIAFLLPAFPSSFKVRLFILYIYWLSHYYKIPSRYSKYRNSYTKSKI